MNLKVYKSQKRMLKKSQIIRVNTFKLVLTKLNFMNLIIGMRFEICT